MASSINIKATVAAASALLSSHAGGEVSLAEASFLNPAFTTREAWTSLQQQQQSATQLPDSLNTLIFFGKKAFKLEEESAFVTTGGVKEFAQWSPQGSMFIALSIRRSERGRDAQEYGRVDFFSASTSKPAAHFSTPPVLLDSKFSEARLDRHIVLVEAIDEKTAILQTQYRQVKNPGEVAKESDSAADVVYKVNMSNGTVIQSWILSEGDALSIQSSGTGERRAAYIFHREERANGTLKCALFPISDASRTTPIALPDNTGFVKMLPDGTMVFNKPGEGKRELVYFDGETFSNSHNIRVESPKKDESVKLSTNQGGSHLQGIEPPSNLALPNKVLLGKFDFALLAPQGANPFLLVAGLENKTWIVQRLNPVDPASAEKSYKDASALYEAKKKSDAIADGLDKFEDERNGDLSGLSDEQIREGILRNLDTEKYGNLTNLFNAGGSQLTFKRDGKDVLCYFNVAGQVFEIGPGSVFQRDGG